MSRRVLILCTALIHPALSCPLGVLVRCFYLALPKVISTNVLIRIVWLVDKEVIIDVLKIIIARAAFVVMVGLVANKQNN